MPGVPHAAEGKCWDGPMKEGVVDGGATGRDLAQH